MEYALSNDSISIKVSTEGTVGGKGVLGQVVGADGHEVGHVGHLIVKKDDKPLTSTKNITEGDQLTVQMRDGELEVEVKNVN